MKKDLVEQSKISFVRQAAKIPRFENDERLVGQTELESMGFRCQPFWDIADDIEGECYREYIENHPDFSLSVRESVAKKLLAAQQNLPQSWSIIIKAGYRPLEVQQRLLEALIAISRSSHPDWNENQHLRYARKYVADPAISCPPHVTGGAVDIDVFDKLSKELVDMGCPPNTDGDIASLHSNLVTAKQRKNRVTLLNAMLGAGFAPLESEWWHYQYGETYWAAFYGQKKTLYDLVG